MTSARAICLPLLLSTTAAAQLAVLDAQPGSASSNPVELVAASDLIYFSVRYSQTGSAQLFRYDGSQLSRVPINGSGASGPNFLVPYGRELLLAAGDGTHGRELVRVRPDGTFTTIDVRPGSTGSFPQELAFHADKLYFSADVPAQGGRHLWSYDPASGAVSRAWGGAGVDSAPTQITSAGPLLFFSAVVPGGVRRLHAHDPATGSTRQLPPSVKPELLTAVGPLVFFRANSTGGNEPWVSDGTTAGTFRLRDIHPSRGSSPQDLVAFGGRCYFSANEGTGTGRTGRELWSSDGTTAGTTRVADINGGRGSSNPSALTPAGDTLFFVARRSSGEGSQLFSLRSGSSTPTRLLVNPSGSAFGGSPDLGAAGADLVLAGAKPSTLIGREPYWVGPSQLRLAANVAAAGASEPSSFVATPTHAYFIANDQGAAGREVYELPLGDSGLATWSSYGDGCPGSQGVPTLRCTAAPRLGGPFALRGDRFVPQAATLLVGGAGVVTRGAPCSLLIRNPLAFRLYLSDAGGTLSVPLSVPNVTTLIGAPFTWQMLGLDSGGFAGVFNATDGVITILGN